MPTFNLLEHCWIPCLRPGDSRPTELGINALLLEAHQLKEIADSSPLVSAAIHRLLLAILHRAFNGPRNPTEWQNLWIHGRWEPAHFQSYVSRWQEHFDLFHAAFPFYQTPILDLQYASPVSRLAIELARGNNPTLFDHTLDALPPKLSSPQAARFLVALQAFDVGGLISFERGQDRRVFGSATNAPLTKGAVGIVKGANLFQTLLLNMHVYRPGDGEPFEAEPDDAPAWERNPETRPLERRPKGYFDLLTWQSRRVRLIPQETRDGGVVISHAVVMKGTEFPREWTGRGGLHGKETMLGFLKSERPAKGESPWRPVAFQPERTLWRDSYALLQIREENKHGPKTIAWLHDLVSGGLLPSSSTVQMDFYGMSTNRAKVNLWRQERLPLPLAYLQETELLAKLKAGLEAAEKVGDILRQALWLTACQILFPAKDPNALTRDNKHRARDLASKPLNPEGPYWAPLEGPFKAFMVTLAAQWNPSSPDTADVLPLDAEGVWADALRRAARSAFVTATSSLERSPRTLKALAIAERSFYGRLRSALSNYTGAAEGEDNDPAA